MLGVRAQSSAALPNDLLFSVPDVATNFARPTIVRLDAQTQNTSVFYSDATATYIQAISWSPHGNLLAVLRSRPLDQNETSFELKYCILTRSGKLQTCLADSPVMNSDIYGGDNLVVTWSDDEKRVYYLTGYVYSNDHALRLIEADANSGQTLRTVYKYALTDTDLNVGNGGEPLISSTTGVAKKV